MQSRRLPGCVIADRYRGLHTCPLLHTTGPVGPTANLSGAASLNFAAGGVEHTHAAGTSSNGQYHGDLETDETSIAHYELFLQQTESRLQL